MTTYNIFLKHLKKTKGLTQGRIGLFYVTGKLIQGGPRMEGPQTFFTRFARSTITNQIL